MNDIESVRRPRRTLGIVVVVAAVLVVAALLYVIFRGSDHKVTFELDSSGEKVSSITYGAGEKQLGKDVGAAAATPWSKSYQLSDSSGDLWMKALSPAGGAITCTILVDDRVAFESTALSGANCQVSFDDAKDAKIEE